MSPRKIHVRGRLGDRAVTLRNRFAGVVLAAGVVITGSAVDLAATATPASAATMTYQVTNYDNDGTSGVYLRNSSNINDVNRDGAHFLTYGTSIQLICAEWGSAVGPSNNTAWDYVQTLNGPNAGRYGHLPEHWINTPIGANQHVSGEPACGSQPTQPTQPQPTPGYASKMAYTTTMTFCPGPGGPNGMCGAGEATASSGSAAHMVCWINPSTDTSHRYFYIQLPGGTEGYVHAESVVQSTQTSTPACSTVNWLNAANWAMSQDGQYAIPSYAKNGNNATYWSGYCWLFAWDTWRQGAGQTPRYSGYSAAAAASAYQSHGLLSAPSGQPPRGSLVFFNYGSQGHAALSLGDGWVETTQGVSQTSPQPVTHKLLSQIGLSQIGYVAPQNV